MAPSDADDPDAGGADATTGRPRLRLVSPGADVPPADPSASLAPAAAGGTATGGDAADEVDPVAAARERLLGVIGAQQQLAQLAEQIAALEVECIEADMTASQSAQSLAMDPQDAARLGALLARKRAVEDGFAALTSAPEPARDDSERIRQLELGVDALRRWLDAPHVKDSNRAATLARVVLLMAVIMLGWAAWVLHWAVLVLIIPIAAPISLMLQRGENTMWRRIGMQRQFQQSGHASPADWEEAPVAVRLAELEHDLDKARRAPPPAPPPDDADLDARYAELSYEQVDVEQTLQRLLERVGVEEDALDDAAREALDRVSGAAAVRKRLESVRRERDTLKRETDDHKDAIFRFLSSRGVAPGHGRADVEALSAGLARLQPLR